MADKPHLEYERHVLGQLCWDCHAATRPSHLQQRRCRNCHRKWSYQGRRIEWEIVKAFALGASVNRTRQVLGCTYPTAYKVFARCRSVLCRWTVAERGLLLEKQGLKERTMAGSKGTTPHLRKAFKRMVIAVIEHDGKVFAIVVKGSKEQAHEAIETSAAAGMVLHADVFGGMRDLVRYKPVGGRSEKPHKERSLDRVEAFWRQTSGHLRNQSRAVAPENLAHYLGEIQFRFNHPGDALVDRLFAAVIESSQPQTVNLDNC